MSKVSENSKSCTYFYEDHTNKLFKLVKLKPALDGDKGVTAHRHNYFEIFIFSHGGGQHLIDFQSFPVKALSVHFVAPGSIHLLRRNQNTKGYVLLLSRDFIEFISNQKFYLSQQPLQPSVEIPEAIFKKLDFHLQLIQEELATEADYSTDIIVNYLQVILLNFQRLFEAQKSSSPSSNIGQNNNISHSPHEEVFIKFNLLMEQDTFHLHQVSEYAQKLHVSPDLLNQICKSKLRKTAISCIQDRLLLEAKRMLFHSDMTSKEIAYALHFNDPAYFGRFFKNKTQLSPKAFRLSIREKYHVLS